MLDLSFYVDEFSADGGEPLVLKICSDFFFLFLNILLLGKKLTLEGFFMLTHFGP